VNKAKLVGKQATCLAVASACIRLYADACKNEQMQPIVLRWLRQGQMKVVLKGDSAEQLVQIRAAAVSRQLATSSVIANDRVLLPNGKTANTKQKKSTDLRTEDAIVEDLAIVGILGPTNDVDQVTGSLKLM
jgi:peptidyl-tRNA hydrolase